MYSKSTPTHKQTCLVHRLTAKPQTGKDHGLHGPIWTRGDLFCQPCRQLSVLKHSHVPCSKIYTTNTSIYRFSIRSGPSITESTSAWASSTSTAPLSHHLGRTLHPAWPVQRGLGTFGLCLVVDQALGPAPARATRRGSPST